MEPLPQEATDLLQLFGTAQLVVEGRVVLAAIHGHDASSVVSHSAGNRCTDASGSTGDEHNSGRHGPAWHDWAQWGTAVA